MPITFDCPCGKTLRVPDEHAGKRVRCPVCAGVATVPAAQPLFEVVEDPSEPPTPPPPPPRAKPLKAVADDDGDDRRGYGVARGARDRDDEEPRKPRPKKKWKERSGEREERKARSTEGGVMNSGVAGGALAMVIAVVWFVVGLMNDWVFFYPPILFILGLVAVIKGLTGEE